MAKSRPTKVDIFRQSLTAEAESELQRLANLPGITGTEVHRWLLEQGYDGSLQSVYVWLERQRETGAEAEKFNALLKTYSGITPEQTLNKLLVVLCQQLDMVMACWENADQPLDPNEYLRQVPNLGREIRSCVQAMHQFTRIRDRRELEAAGAYRLAQELRLVFNDTPFENSLEEGLKSAFDRIEEADG